MPAVDRKSPQIDEEVLFFQLFLLGKQSGTAACQHPLLTHSALLWLILQADINPNDEGGRGFLILRILKLYALGLRLMPKQ